MISKILKSGLACQAFLVLTLHGAMGRQRLAELMDVHPTTAGNAAGELRQAGLLTNGQRRKYELVPVGDLLR